MQQFKIPPTGVKEIIAQRRPQLIAILSIAIVAAMILLFNYPQDQASTVNVLPFVIPFFLAIVTWAYLRGIKRQKTLLGTFVIVVAENEISRQQLDTPMILISMDDIKEILKDKKGNLAIKGGKSKNTIHIPAQIDNFSELATLLHQIKPITEQNPYSIIEQYPIPAGLLSSGLFLSVYLSTNRIIVGVTGTLLLALMIWSFYQMRSNKHIDEKTRKKGYFMLLVIVSIIGIMISKLAGIAGY